MTTDEIDDSKRRFLLTASSVAGATAMAAMAVPFAASWFPSARARAAGAPVEVDISKIEPGQLITVEWRGKPVWILNRTAQMLQNLPSLDRQLSDPRSTVPQQPPYAKNEHRSLNPSIWVGIGICTHLGCSPIYRQEIAPSDLGNDWKGGFFCPCHGSLFDLAGRVYAGSPAPTNLEVPPHQYLASTLLLIGDDRKGE